MGQRLKGDNHVAKENLSMLLFMERYEMNLHEYVVSRRKKNQPFSREEVNTFLGQMLKVLEQMQMHGMAHRDIKP